MRRLGLALAGLSVIALTSVGALAQTLDTLPFNKKLALAKAGDEEAQIAVAGAYEKGKDVKQSKVEASKWYGKAADQGNSDAQFKLATLFHEGGPGLKKSPERAAKLYEAAAKQGHVEAQNWLGYCYQHGLGVAQDDTKAVEWYRKAADAKLAMAQNNLGLMYLSGKGGLEEDYAKAFELFQSSANQGYDWGMNNLGGLYEKGWGTEQDMAKALFLYREAAAKGNEAAQKSAKRIEPLVIKAEANPSVEPAAGEPEKTTVTPPAAKVTTDSSAAPKPLSAENPLEGKPKLPPEPAKTIKSDSSSD